jgi:uncharacterized RDD family membrane protein YckC
MTEVDKYINQVLHHVHAPERDRVRFAADLQAHVQEAVAVGESQRTVLARMGSPTEVAAEFMAQVSLTNAGFWRRAVAYAIDLAMVFVVASVFGVLAIFATNLVPRHPAGVDWVVGGALILLIVAMASAALGVILLYFPVLEGRFGQTVGKRLLGISVLKENGLPIGYGDAFLRRLSYYFEFLPLDALFVPFTTRQQRAFDIVARTIVVRDGA